MASKHLVNRAKRSSIVHMTNEARVLKGLREAAGLSMRQAGKLLGKSDSYISHLENGRMSIPAGQKLEELLKVYCGMKPKSFRERARKLDHSLTPQQEINDWVRRANDSDIRSVLKFIRGYL